MSPLRLREISMAPKPTASSSLRAAVSSSSKLLSSRRAQSSNHSSTRAAYSSAFSWSAPSLGSKR